MKKQIITVATLLSCLPGLSGATAVFAAGTSWQVTVAKTIAARQTYPRSAQMRGEEGTTKIAFNVDAGGTISDVHVMQSSGSTILDRQANSIIEGIKQVPAPPPGITTVTVPIVWRLDK